VLDQRCAEVHRDPAAIETSVNLRYQEGTDAAAVAEQAAAFAEVGVDVAVVNLSPPHRPVDVERLAGALGELADA
jgi:hypothetical protein